MDQHCPLTPAPVPSSFSGTSIIDARHRFASRLHPVNSWVWHAEQPQLGLGQVIASNEHMRTVRFDGFEPEDTSVPAWLVHSGTRSGVTPLLWRPHAIVKNIHVSLLQTT